jgi:hypothetical protein
LVNSEASKEDAEDSDGTSKSQQSSDKTAEEFDDQFDLQDQGLANFSKRIV